MTHPSRSLTSPTARGRVVTHYPTAYVQEYRTTAAPLFVVRQRGLILGEGRTRAEAWANAAQRIERAA